MFPIFDPYLVTKHKLMNLFPKGEQYPFLYKLSYLIYYLIQFHLLRNPIPPLPEANLLTPVLLWEGPPIRIVWRIALGPWGHPEFDQSRREQVHPGAVSLSDPLGKCLFKCPVGSFHHPRTLGPICSMQFPFDV